MEKSQDFIELRRGCFTSSKIFNLCTSGKEKDSIGKPFYAYCKKVAAERFFNTRVIDGGSLSTDWGNLAEKYVGSILEKEGITVGFSDSPMANKELESWHRGTPDCLSRDTVFDIKCPTSLEHYFELYGCTEQDLKKNDANFYWQLVSNSIITNKPYAELVVFYPNFDDLQAILELNRQESISFRIEWKDIDDLPCLGEDRSDMNIYRLRWRVLEEDKQFITERIRLAIIEVERLISEKLKRINNGNN